MTIKEVMVAGYTSYIASIRLDNGRVISVTSATEEMAIMELEEEIRFASSSNPNQGVNFDEDEEDYYA